MRITAAILMVMAGSTSSVIVTSELVDIFRFGETTSIVFVFLCLLSLGLIWGGGISASRKKAYRWALSGAICSVLVAFTYTLTSTLTSLLRFPFSLIGPSIAFTMMGILALIFLIKSKGEFQS
jgi:hypothetical protein